MSDPKYLSPAQAAAVYDLNTGTLANLRWRKEGPRYKRVGRKILYRRSDLEGWIDAGTVATIDQLAQV